MIRIVAIILAVGALTAADLAAQVSSERRYSTWPEEEAREKTPLSKWLPQVLGKDAEATATAEDAEPAAPEPAPAPRRQQPQKRVAEPEPDPEPKLTAEEQEAEDRWWKEVGDAAVEGFSRCLTEHVVDEVTSGSQSSYPEFVTTAMNGRCSREFAAMAQLILDRYGDEQFARIARKLIATRFVPTVKRVVEAGPPEESEPADQRPALEAEVRRAKEAMLACLAVEADRQAANSSVEAERLADRVIAACEASAEAFLGKIEQLYPGATGGEGGEKSTAILDASYRPAIMQRIASVRANRPDGGTGAGTGDGTGAGTGSGAVERTGAGSGGPAGSGKADAESTTVWKQPEVVSPAGEPQPGSPVPASSRP